MSNTVPEGWEEFCLKDLSDVITKGTTPTTGGSGYVQSGIKYFRVENISRSGFIEEKDLKFISQETHDSLKRSQLKVGDLLVSIAGAIGRSAIVGKNNVPANTNQAVGIVRLRHNEVITPFVRYSIESPMVARQLNDAQAGNAQINLNLEQLGSLRFYRPPLSEQQKIAAILSSVDEVIEKTRAQIDKLKDLKTGMMQELLTKGIGHTEFKDSPVGRIPEVWSVVDLQMACESKYGIVDGPFGSNLKTEHYQESGIPVFQSGLVTSNQFIKREYVYVNQEKFNEQKRSSAKAGDILMAKIGMRAGACAIIPKNHPEGILAGNSLKMSVDSNKAIADYILGILHLMQSTGEIRRLLTETAQPAVSITTLKKMKIALPPLDEQKAISETLGSLDAKVLRTKEKLDQTLRLKKALMQDLLTGKVRVNVDTCELADA
ncbi:MAG: hsdS2 [Halomonas sp. 54_146]|nr:restriction endonuclease subunit S [Halomonas sp. 54_146]KUJ86688.1 MAG: hsdS2 [Halomonas sp. 54_146]